MKFQDFMSRVRYWDNLCARWMMRHFYILFFQIVLVIIFFIFFFNTIKTIDLSTHVAQQGGLTEQLLLQQSTHTLLIIILLILNSFWTLFIFNGINRLQNILREMNYNLTRRPYKPKN